MNDQVIYIRDFGRRVIKIASLIAGVVCASALLLGYTGVALGFGLGSIVSIAGFWFAARKSVGLLSVRNSKMAAAISFKWFLPRFMLYGLALLIGAKYSSVDFVSVVVGTFVCNLVLVIYEPVIARFLPGLKRTSEVI
ncbi:ATP synthase subunit I [bacterium]|nr:ATP synthase subunit I [bacterium]